MKYAILDIEATGGKAGTEKIIDIAIYQFDGQLVTDQFASMVNPERGIDPYVQKLTNITDKMVRRAPKFHELAKRIVEITEDAILVGHGVHFDYRMLKQEFRQLGYNYERQTLDTVVISQKLIPEAASHSLGKLSKSLGIPVSSRHRADGDTRATLELFKILLEKDSRKNIIQTYAKKEPKSKKQVNKLLGLEKGLPASTGVFYLHAANGKLVHIGAAKNIQIGVNQIFTQRNANAYRLQSIVENITYEITGSFLIALLKAADEQKGKRNLISVKTTSYNYAIFTDEEKILKIDKLHHQKKHPLLILENRKKAEQKLRKWFKQFDDYSTAKKLYHNIKQDIQYPYKHLILLDKGREKGEYAFIEIDNGSPIGYGYYKLYNQLEDNKIREQITVPLSKSIYNKVIVKSFVQEKKFLKLIPFNEDKSIKIPKINERPRQKNKR